MNYPYDIVSYVRTNKTFAISAQFSVETKESPLKVFSSFSRFVLVAINDKKAATGNLHISDLAGIVNATKYAYNKHMELKNKPISEGSTSPAFTVRFTSGALKGKTPAEVLLSDPENGKTLLNKQYIWLKSNLDKYPNNQKLMDAIKDAGNIDVSAVPKSESVAPVTIISVENRPLIRNKRADGMAPCYEYSVIWDFSRKYPVVCTIRNFYAPVKEKNKLLNIEISKKDTSTEVVSEISMTAEEWLNAVDCMESAKNAFYMCNFNKAYNLANEESLKAASEAKASKGETA